jgi:hypothetical protein
MRDVLMTNPVLNSPHDEPTRHFRFDDEGITEEIVPGRRLSSYVMPIPRINRNSNSLRETHAMATALTPDTAPVALTSQQAAQLLRAALSAIQAEFAASPEALLRWRPAPGEWSALEVLGHLIEAEQRGFAGRIRIILAEGRPRFSGWDPAAVAAARRDAEGNPTALIGEFSDLRTGSIELVASLSEADLSRGGEHPEVGWLTVRDLLHEWVHHDRNHIRQLMANVQSYTWPHMGNAQRFSG